MVTRSLLLVLLARTCLSQYDMQGNVRADMTFNADNDRFDVGNLFEQQKQAYKEMPSAMELDGRRRLRPLAELLKQDRRRYQQAHEKSLRQMNSDFAYHDLMLEDRDYVHGEYEKNLDPFKVQKKQTRKTLRDAYGRLFNRLVLGNKPKKSVSAKKPKKPIRTPQKPLSSYISAVKKLLHGGGKKASRRISDSNVVDEVLLHYAVPLNMKVKGYLKLPEDSKLE